MAPHSTLTRTPRPQPCPFRSAPRSFSLTSPSLSASLRSLRLVFVQTDSALAPVEMTTKRFIGSLIILAIVCALILLFFVRTAGQP
jgi:hypothetical protein